MNIDMIRLKQATDEYQDEKLPDHKKRAAHKRMLLHGARLYRWTKDTEGLLARQLAWLDDHPDNDKRFGEWTDLLREYEQACDLLRDAEQVIDAPITLQVAA